MRSDLLCDLSCLFTLFEAFCEAIGLYEAVEVFRQQFATYTVIERMRKLLIQCLDLGL